MNSPICMLVARLIIVCFYLLFGLWNFDCESWVLLIHLAMCTAGLRGDGNLVISIMIVLLVNQFILR